MNQFFLSVLWSNVVEHSVHFYRIIFEWHQLSNVVWSFKTSKHNLTIFINLNTLFKLMRNHAHHIPFLTQERLLIIAKPSGFLCRIAWSSTREVASLPEMVKKDQLKASCFLPQQLPKCSIMQSCSGKPFGNCFIWQNERVHLSTLLVILHLVTVNCYSRYCIELKPLQMCTKTQLHPTHASFCRTKV